MVDASGHGRPRSAYVVWLDDPVATPERVGPKAAVLGELMRAELPVPAGFCLTVAAGEQVLDGAGLSEQSAEVARLALSGGEWRKAAVRLRAELARADLPVDVVHALGEAFDVLRGSDGSSLAARSSAVAEDRARASFAGQFSTILGVGSFEQLLAAVRSCWTSRFSDSVIRYALGRGVDLDGTRMAVLVQEMVKARSAGAALSRDPADPSGSSLVVSGAWGLGRAVAEGEVTPDHWRLARDGLSVLERRIGDKPLASTVGPRGEEWRRLPPQRASAPCLPRTALAQIGALALEAERLCGEPQEIEWALDEEREVWLLQSRAISVTAVEAAESEDQDLEQWLRRGNVVEGTPTSPGRAIGRARLLRSPEDVGQVQAGEVIVAPTLRPSTTVVLPQVAALVVEAGGTTSHAATLARERRIPAIMGARGATRSIPDGALVLVDGTAGRAWFREGVPPQVAAYRK